MSRILLGLIAAALAGATFAINMSGFNDAPLTRLTQPELEQFRAFVEKSLDDIADGKTVEWKAPKTQFTSKITPEKSFTDAGRRCRNVTIDSKSRDRQMRGLYMFCKVGTGEWEFRLPGGR